MLTPYSSKCGDTAGGPRFCITQIFLVWKSNI
uniref:Uncharacterized protein n=1 Tax=Rhizophora mucronata TaxID=61149 RepID=A0A2P2Q2T6_RHIMU